MTAVLGGHLAWVTDTDSAASAVLAHHHPDTPNLGDIRAVEWGEVERVDVLTAGIPCQSISNAGKRQGVSDERWLWPATADALRRLRPRVFFLENVAALRKRGLGDILAGLAALGYDARWLCLRASAIGAPHHRDRLFLLAEDSRRMAQDPHVEHLGERGQPAPDEATRRRARPEPARRSGTPVANTEGLRRQRAMPPRDRRPGSADGRHAVAHPEHAPRTALDPNGPVAVGRGRSTPATPDAAGDRRDEGIAAAARKRRRPDVAVPRDATPQALTPLLTLAGTWGRYADAIARWENITGRPAPAPLQPVRGNMRLSTALVEWMMGLTSGYVTEVAGLSRNAAFRILGNGVVPAQGAAALRLLLS